MVCAKPELEEELSVCERLELVEEPHIQKTLLVIVGATEVVESELEERAWTKHLFFLVRNFEKGGDGRRTIVRKQ